VLKDRFGSKWIQINLSHWEHNLNWIQKRVSPAELMPVIKANAYGHGAIKLASAAEKMGVQCLVVATLREAMELRRNFINTKLLVLGGIPASQMADAINYRITPTICCKEEAISVQEHAERVGQTIKVQVYVDTGMGRMGQTPAGLVQLFDDLEELGNIEVEALYSHFAVADEVDSESQEFTKQQWQRLRIAFEEIKHPKLKLHICNSGGVLEHLDFKADAVRPGLMCYGIATVGPDQLKKQLKPVMSLHCRPSFIKRMKAGESVGYGRIFKLERDTNIMTLPVGYADGISRRLGAYLKVGVKNKFYSVVGRVCMDMLMVDLEDDQISLEDEVIIMGEGAARVEDLADWTKTIPYEIFTQLGRRWNYVYTRENKVEEIVWSDA
jgi:alanine racemase